MFFIPPQWCFPWERRAQKSWGLPGENSKGIYSAEDFVYHYSLLPPFATKDFSTGKRVAIVGMGNVMVDVAAVADR